MQYRKKCIICGKEFDSPKEHTKTCSEECRHTKNLIRSRENHKARATKEQVKKPKEKEVLVAARKCESCVYRCKIEGCKTFCQYILVTGKMRLCEGGDKCTEYKRGKPLVAKDMDGEHQNIALKNINRRILEERR